MLPEITHVRLIVYYFGLITLGKKKTKFNCKFENTIKQQLTSIMWSQIIQNLKHCEALSHYIGTITSIDPNGLPGTTLSMLAVGAVINMSPVLIETKQLFLTMGYAHSAEYVGTGLWCLNVLLQGGYANPPVGHPQVAFQLKYLCTYVYQSMELRHLSDYRLSSSIYTVVYAGLITSLAIAVNIHYINGITASPYIDTLLTFPS